MGSDPKHCYKLVNRENRELKRLICSVNYDTKGGHERKGEGIKLFFMKPKIVSWNVRGLNENEKRLKIGSLPKDYKAGIVVY